MSPDLIYRIVNHERLEFLLAKIRDGPDDTDENTILMIAAR